MAASATTITATSTIRVSVMACSLASEQIRLIAACSARQSFSSGALNWNIGTASVFAWALSVMPAKDGWWTTPSQPGHPYKDNRTENLGALHGAVATMSRGPVSPADKIGLFNRSQIMRSW